MKEKLLVAFSVTMFLCLSIFGKSVLAQDSRLEPKRLASVGDSITEAIDAEVYGANHWASWANGYHGFWQWLFGLSNVNSHNQRITKKFGRKGRKNFLEAESGADSFDLADQTQGAVDHQATYVPWLMGHNDICQDQVEDIPEEDVFEQNVREGLNRLSEGLPPGATIYVLGMVDVPHLYEVAQDKKALGIVDCEVLWFTTVFELFPCRTVLGPFRTEADRLAMRARIEGDEIFEGFNPILQRLVEEFGDKDPAHHYFYTDDVFNYKFFESQVSDLDCFHPSPKGQRELSRITWEAIDGPLFQKW